MKSSLSFSVLSLGLLCILSLPAQAGLMHPDYDLQTYRDFAENRGKFAADATNVEITFKDGTKAGVIPRIMSFESVVDQGFASLTGNAQFLATVAHNGGYQDASFTKRFGGDDFYRVIKKNNGWGSETNYQYDIQVARLDKMVTEADFVPYMEDEAQLAKLENKLVIRVGGGTQNVAITNSEAKNIAGAYEFLTGGTLRFAKVIVNPPAPNEKHLASPYKAYQFQYNLKVENDPATPLPIGVLAGDSGSASWTWNDKTKRWEYIGPGQSGGGNGFSQMRGANAWCVDVIKSYFDPTVTAQSGSPVLWHPANEKGEGKLAQGSRSWNYHGLAAGKKAATASLDELEATRSLTFSGKNATIQLIAPIDMGAGTLTIEENHTLTPGKDATASLNCAGMDIKEKATVTSTLTSAEGDEWRKIGKGTLMIRGKGDNPVRLNIGEGAVLLGRDGGKAAAAVKLVSGRGSVILQNDSQLAGPVEFGVRGGVLDLNGTNVTWDAIPHKDTGATLYNGKKRTLSCFTYRGEGAYLGKFNDSEALNPERSSRSGKLSVCYDPTNPDSRWDLQGDINIRGTFHVKKGKVTLKGAPVLHANKFIDPNDWRTATFQGAAPVVLEKGTSFTLGDHSMARASFRVSPEAELAVLDKSNWTGKAILEPGAVLRIATSEGARNRTLDIQGESTLIPVLPEGADKSKTIVLDLGQASLRKQAKQMAACLKPASNNDPAGKWEVGSTPEGMLRAAWIPAKQ